jgi:hypothetical protein
MNQTVKNAHLECAEQIMLHIGNHQVGLATELLAPTVTYRVAGNHALAGTFSGPGEVARHLSHLFEFTHGTFDVFKWEDWLVGENHVAAVVDVHMEAERRAFVGKHIFVFQFNSEGLVKSITVFFEDEGSARRFFGQ